MAYSGGSDELFFLFKINFCLKIDLLFITLGVGSIHISGYTTECSRNIAVIVCSFAPNAGWVYKVFTSGFRIPIE